MADATTVQGAAAAAPGAPGTPAAAAAPVPGSAEYNAAMAAKGEGAVAGTQQVTQDAPILGKFKTQDDLVRAYQELEKKLGTPAAAAAPADPAKPADTAGATKPALTITPEQKAAETAVQSAGLDFAALNTEFAEKGALSPESYAAMEQRGITKAVVDSYIAGQQALNAQYEAKAFTEAGGQEQFSQMSQWAAKNLPAAEIAAFNDAVDSGDEAKMRFAVSGLKARFTAALGSTPNLVQGGNTSAVQGYQSLAQMKADMAKPEYQKDPAFRQQVMDRIAANPELFSMQEVRGAR
jgi:hypothetical protein